VGDPIRRDAAAQRDHSSDVRRLGRPGDVAEDDLAHVGRSEARPRQNRLDGDAAELVRRHVRECAERLGERRPHAGHDG
jgi:hypothetical protein